MGSEKLRYWGSYSRSSDHTQMYTLSSVPGRRRAPVRQSPLGSHELLGAFAFGWGGLGLARIEFLRKSLDSIFESAESLAESSAKFGKLLPPKRKSATVATTIKCVGLNNSPIIQPFVNMFGHR